MENAFPLFKSDLISQKTVFCSTDPDVVSTVGKYVRVVVIETEILVVSLFFFFGDGQKDWITSTIS